MRTRYRWLIAAVVVAIAVASATIALRHHNGPPDAPALGVPVVVGTTAYLTDGSRVDLDVDGRSKVDQVTVVPGGIVFDTYGVDEPHSDGIWLRQHDGGLHPLGYGGNRPFTVSRDGRTLVAVALEPPDGLPGTVENDADVAFDRVTAIDLTTGAVLATTLYSGGNVVDANGDWVLLRTNGGAATPVPELWNVRTGKLTPFASGAGVVPLAVTASGEVFRRVSLPPPGNNTWDACYDLVKPTATVPTGFTGFCGDKDIIRAALSPDGKHLLADTHDNIYVVDVDRFLRGQWTAVVLRTDTGGNSDTYWASDTSLITPEAGEFERCSISGHCVTHHLASGGLTGFTFPAAA